MKKLSELLPHLEVLGTQGKLDVTVSGISCDSRRVSRGHVFVAIPGTKQDGYDYAPAAVEAGAVAVVSQRATGLTNAAHVQVADARRALARLAAAFHDFPERRLHVIGVTGTNGKTTTTYLIRSILEAAGCKTGLIGTVSYAIGDARLPAEQTTPDAPTLHALLARMRQASVSHVVMEVSSHGLAQERVHGVRFRQAVFTNFSREHLDYHRTLEAYFAAKRKLFSGLRKQDVAILNRDDAHAGEIAEATDAQLVWYGRNAAAVACSGEVVEATLQGTRFRLRLSGHRLEVRSHLVGRFHLHNVLAAAAAAWKLGVQPRQIEAGIASVTAVPGRLERLETGLPFEVFIDFAHTPKALQLALQEMRRLTSGRVHLVFGCGGERDVGKRPLMGRVAGELADHVILTSDNPRSEAPERILADIDAGVRDRKKRTLVPDRREAIAAALARARPGDLVLIAGKGHETYQEIDGQRRSFDDRAVVQEVLASLA